MEIYDKTHIKFADSKEENKIKKKREKQNFVSEFLRFHLLILIERIIIAKQLVLWLNTVWFIAHFMIRSKRCQTLVQW